jgi:hypothetical protein
MNGFWLAAAFASAATCAVHTFVGGRVIAGPLLAAGDLRTVPKVTAYFCWHMVTIVLAAMTVGFGWAAANPRGAVLAWFLVGLAMAFALLNLGLGYLWRLHPLRRLPQWMFFVLIAGLGVAGAL